MRIWEGYGIRTLNGYWTESSQSQNIMQDRFHGGESSGMSSHFTGRHHLGHFVFFNLADGWERTSRIWLAINLRFG